MRDTCLYCEQIGVTTELTVEYGPWRLCPLHSADFIKQIEGAPKAPPRPELINRGRPTINGRKT